MTVSYGFYSRWHLASTRLLSQLPRSWQQLLCHEEPMLHEGQRLSPQLQLLRNRLYRHSVQDWSSQFDIQHIRSYFDDLLARLAGPAIEIYQTTDLLVPSRDGNSIQTRMYLPFASSEPLPTLLYVHGGSYVMGSIEAYDQTCRALAAHSGMQVVSIDYRLAPEHPFPAALHDCIDVWTWLQANSEQLNIDPNQLMIGGDSVGGTLSTVTTRQLSLLGLPAPHLQLLLYPSIDPTGIWPSHQRYQDQLFISHADRDYFFEQYRADHDTSDPRLSPLYASDARQCQTLLVTAGFCPLRDEGRAYANMLANQHVRVCHLELTTLTHSFANFVGVSNDCYRGLAEVAETFAVLCSEASTTA